MSHVTDQFQGHRGGGTVAAININNKTHINEGCTLASALKQCNAISHLNYKQLFKTNG